MFLYLLFAVVVVVGFTSGEEEHCSKFHYEKKTLEMMIRMEIRMEDMQRKLDKLEMNYEEFNASVTTEQKERTIAFFATKQSNTRYGAHEGIVFGNVVTNIGDAYDPTSGIFSAPTSGTYEFFSTVLGYTNVELWNYIALNDNAVAFFNSHGTEGRHDDGTATVILQLNKRDNVSVKNQYKGGHTYGDKYTHFGGFRL